MNITSEQLQAAAKSLTPAQRAAAGLSETGGLQPQKHNRFHNRRINGDGVLGRRWDSVGEMKCGLWLFDLENVGVISQLEFQVPVTLLEYPKIVLRVDFAFIESGQQIFADFKARRDYDHGATREMYRDWIIKRHLWVAGFGPAPLRVFYPAGNGRYGVHEYKVCPDCASKAMERLKRVCSDDD